ncbi:MAG: Panacea domain-containing protein [Fastidiosipilaceae bacterium]|jgi:uncharacterized phage-associated protein
MASIFDVADWFLSKEPMTHNKLQKLTYYTVAWGHALLEQPLAGNPQFKAEAHGPVSAELRSKYERYGWDLIPQTNVPTAFTEEEVDLLESVYLTYGSKCANELEALTLSEMPLIKAHDSGEVININEMKQYYRSIYIG